MIGSLSGKPTIIDAETLLIEVNGVGYQVLTPTRIINSLEKKDSVRLWIYTHVREEVLDLFGFLRREELQLFKHLVAISGIGPRTALTILNYEVEAIERAVFEGDVNFFTTIPRLGRKTAQRLIIELQSKLGSKIEFNLDQELEGETKQIIDALINMGFSRKETINAVREVSKKAMTIEEKIKNAIKLLGKKSDTYA